MDRVEEIDLTIKENTRMIEISVNLVNRTIDKEFSLMRENKALKQEKKEIILRRYELE